MLTIEAMTDHVKSLTEAHEILVNYDSDEVGDGPEDGFAAVELREIWIPTIRSYGDYCTGLHEVGHILGGPECWSPDRMARERAAWTWARENALEWTAEAEAIASDCLAFYETEIAAGRISRVCD